MPTATPPRKRVHNPDLKKALVLESATALFIERGFDAVSMRDIASHSGVSQSLIHHYFGSKEGLWGEVKRACYDPYLTAQQALMDAADVDTRAFVDHSARARFHFFQTNPRVIRLLQWLQLMADPLGMETGQDTGPRLLARIRQAQADGDIRADMEAENIAAIALALTTYWFQNRHVIQHMADLPDEDMAAADQRYLDAVLKFLSSGLRLSDQQA